VVSSRTGPEHDERCGQGATVAPERRPSDRREAASYPVDEEKRLGDPITLDPACYENLRALAEDLRARGIDFTYVISPMRPGYLAGRDPDGALLVEHRRRLEAALVDSGAVLIDAHEALNMPEEAFFDAYHLNRDEARHLTRFVTERLLAGSRPPEEPSTSPAAASDPGPPAGS
jgi:hypothetical protein